MSGTPMDDVPGAQLADLEHRALEARRYGEYAEAAHLFGTAAALADPVERRLHLSMRAAHCHVAGRHVGTDLGGPATGAAVNFWGITILRAENGRIVEGWNSFDCLSLYQQIGWVPTPG